LDAAFELAVARPARDKEKRSLLRFLALSVSITSRKAKSLEDMKVGIAAPPSDIAKSELAAWTQVCRVILNLQETVTRY